jgi:hypothetical protein
MIVKILEFVFVLFADRDILLPEYNPASLYGMYFFQVHDEGPVLINFSGGSWASRIFRDVSESTGWDSPEIYTLT